MQREGRLVNILAYCEREGTRGAVIYPLWHFSVGRMTVPHESCYLDTLWAQMPPVYLYEEHN